MRHEKVCSSQRQRKVFDSSKMRLQGTEAATVKRKSSPPPSKARVSHEIILFYLRSFFQLGKLFNLSTPFL